MVRIDGLSWDQDAEDHIAHHNVTVDEVEEAVTNIRYAKVIKRRLCVIGQTEAGRYLTVFLDDDGDNHWYPVTARTADPSERRLLRRRKATRGST